MARIAKQKPEPAPERVAAFKSGISAESKAALYLVARGYRILARRFRTPAGEIDIVARRRGVLAFVEVKARASFDEAAEAVTGRQQRRIVDAAQYWLAARPQDGTGDIRFDAIFVVPGKLPKHLTSAFDAGF